MSGRAQSRPLAKNLSTALEGTNKCHKCFQNGFEATKIRNLRAFLKKNVHLQYV